MGSLFSTQPFLSSRRHGAFFFFACFFFFRNNSVLYGDGGGRRCGLQRFAGHRMNLRGRNRRVVLCRMTLKGIQPIDGTTSSSLAADRDNAPLNQNAPHAADGRFVEFRAVLQHRERNRKLLAPATAVRREHQGMPQHDGVRGQRLRFKPVVEMSYLREVVHCRPCLHRRRSSSLREGSAGRATSPMCTSRSIFGIRTPPLAATLRMP